MSKYNNKNYQFTSPLVEGEKVLWDSKPKKNAFILNQILTIMPFALIWLLFDSMFIVAMLSTGELTEFFYIIIPFFVFHLMPVWMWLVNVFTANRKWINTVYYITDKRIIIQSGFIGIDYKTIYFKDIKNVTLSVGFVDKLLGVGDIHFYLNNNHGTNSFLDIKNPYEVYPKIQKIVLDMQTDMTYPNALRPEENPGYNTQYNPENPIKFE